MSPRVGFAALAALLGFLASGCRCEGEGPPDGGPVEDGGEPDAGEPDGGEADAGGPDAGLSPEAFCAAVTQARCERELSCGFLGATELPTCRSRLALECAADFRRVDAGSSRFLPTAAQACLDELASLRCIAGPLSSAPRCAFHQVFAPAAQPGTRCLDSEDCLTGFCFGTSFECRSCRAFTALGQPCSSTDRRCDPTLHFCPADVPRVCTALLAEGAPCGSSSECAAHWCNWNSQVPDAGPDRCGHLALGSACGDPDDCVSGAWCQGYGFDGVTVTAGVCAPRLALDAPCTNTPDDDGCVVPASCLGGRCAVALPYSLDAGAECEHLTECAESLFCRGLEAPQPDGGRSLREGVCTVRLPAGAGCSYATYVDTDCSPATTCGQNGTCVPRGPSDAGCQARYECQDFLACPRSTSRCTPFSSSGEACELTGSVCLDSWCGATPDGGPSCQPLLQDGASCSVLEPARCASSRCFTAGAAGPTCQSACFP